MAIDLKKIQAKHDRQPTAAELAIVAEWAAYDKEQKDWADQCIAQGITGEAFRQTRDAIRQKYLDRGLIQPAALPQPGDED